MTPTVFQPAELRDAADNIIQPGAYGKNTPLCNDDNDAWIDYVMNNLEFLNKLAVAEIVPVTELPASGDINKKYLITTGSNAGELYIWTGSAWQETVDSVSRAEAAAHNASVSQNAAAASERSATTSAQNANSSAAAAAGSAGAAEDSATAAADSAITAKKYADQAMSGTPEGYESVADVVRGLVGYKFVINAEDLGLDFVSAEQGGVK